jgi:xanthine dehydrogenase small subunit
MSVFDLGSLHMERVASLDQLCGLVLERNAAGDKLVLLAGGTDWMVEQEMRQPFADAADRPLLVDISRLPELRGIEIVSADGGGDILRIGSATTFWEMRQSPLVAERAPMIARMAADVGAIQIQARGTFGGNLATASPAADGVAALAAYDASLVVQSARGRRTIPFADLQTGYKQTTRAPDEVFVAIEIALPPVGSRWAWRKVGTRKAQAISKVALAGVAVIEAGRLVRCGLGMASVAPVTARMSVTRALCVSRPLADLTPVDLDRAVDEDIAPIDDIRSTREYRRHVARAVTREWLRELGAPV